MSEHRTTESWCLATFAKKDPVGDGIKALYVIAAIVFAIWAIRYCDARVDRIERTLQLERMPPPSLSPWAEYPEAEKWLPPEERHK